MMPPMPKPIRIAPLVRVALLTAVVLATARCNWFHNSNNTSTSPSTTLTDTFSGLLNQNSFAIFTFSTAQSGTVAVTLTAVTPATSAPLNLGVGTPGASNTCTLTTSTSSAVAGAIAQITTSENAGSYCVKVYDTGSLSANSTVTVTVAHN